MKYLVLGFALLCAPALGEDFMVVVFPDIQQRLSVYTSHWDPMVRWILDNRLSSNIKAVYAVGDIVDDANSAQQWTRAMQGIDGSHGFNAIDSAGLIYGSAPGNHDSYDFRGNATFNAHFGPGHFSGKTWYGGTYETNNGGNWYEKWEVGPLKFLTLGLEFYARPAALTWALGIIDANPDRYVLVITHSYLDRTASRFRATQMFGPKDYGLTSGDVCASNCTDGAQLWDGLLKLRKNILLVVNGHDTAANPAYRSDTGTYGNTVHQIYTAHGGDNAIIVTLAFKPPQNTITFRAFDVETGLDLANSPHEFALTPLAVSAGVGCTTVHAIDRDCDGYGVGPVLLGPDADDSDPTVHTAEQARTKYAGGTAASDGLSVFLAHLGYTPVHYYYVSTTGDDNTGRADDPTKPYASISGLRGKHAPTADDIVLLRGGTYVNDNWSLIYPATSGTPGHPIIFMAYPGERVVMDTAYDWGGDPDHGNHDLVFDGINWTNSLNAGLGRTYAFGANLSGSAQNITIRHSEVWNRANGVFAMQGLNNLLIEENVFHDSTSHSIYVGARDVPNADVTIRNNVFYRPGFTCVQHNGRVTNYVLEGNICHSFSNATGFSLEMGVSNSFVRNNLVFDGGRTPLVIYDYPAPDQSLYPGVLPHNQTGNVIENNTFVVGTRKWEDGTPMMSGYPNILISLETLEQDQDIGTNTFRNNLLINTSGAAPVVYSTRQCTYTCGVAGSCTGSDYCMNGSDPAIQANRSTWENNLIYTTFERAMQLYNTQATLGSPPGTPPDSIDNSYTLAQLNGYTGNYSANIGDDPKVVRNVDSEAQHPEYYSFAIQPGSAAIGMGTPTDAPPKDILGRDRQGAPDIGAYEYIGPTAPRITSVSPLPGGTVGSAYAQWLTASGDNPIGWTSSDLPAWLILDSNGLLHGTALGAGTYTFHVTASNAAGSDSDEELSVTIAGGSSQRIRGGARLVGKAIAR